MHCQVDSTKNCPCWPQGTTQSASCNFLNPSDCCTAAYTVDYANDANSGANFDKPLCDFTTTPPQQVYAKGYPGLREIAVLRDYAQSTYSVSPNSIVASICPKDLTSADYESRLWLQPCRRGSREPVEGEAQGPVPATFQLTP